MKNLFKKWALKTGIGASILDVIGFISCCVPFLTVFFTAIGISVLFFHRVSLYFVLLGISLIAIGIYIAVKGNKACKK